VLPLSAQGTAVNRTSLPVLLIALMAANCATSAPMAIGMSLSQTLTGVEPSLVSVCSCQAGCCRQAVTDGRTDAAELPKSIRNGAEAACFVVFVCSQV
jgi:hypothetical protein